ncbi:hypothetical protein CsatA_022397 [Cannabis sativa]
MSSKYLPYSNKDINRYDNAKFRHRSWFKKLLELWWLAELLQLKQGQSFTFQTWNMVFQTRILSGTFGRMFYKTFERLLFKSCLEEASTLQGDRREFEHLKFEQDSIRKWNTLSLRHTIRGSLFMHNSITLYF